MTGAWAEPRCRRRPCFAVRLAEAACGAWPGRERSLAADGSRTLRSDWPRLCVGRGRGVGGVSTRSAAVLRCVPSLLLGPWPSALCPGLPALSAPCGRTRAAGRVKELCRGRMRGFMEPMSSPVRWGHSHRASWSAGCRGKRAAQASAQPRATATRRWVGPLLRKAGCFSVRFSPCRHQVAGGARWGGGCGATKTRRSEEGARH